MSDLTKGLADLPQELLEALAKQHKDELDRRRFNDPTAFFPWHSIQTAVLEAPDLTPNPIRMILVAGGNRAGKSAVAKGIWSQLVRRTSPLNNQLATLDPYSGKIRVKGKNDPLTTWIIPPTLNKARADWIAPSDGHGLKFWAGSSFLEYREQPDLVIYTKTPGLDPWTEDRRGQKAVDPGMCDQALVKSQDQSLLTFESSAVDAAFVDEEIQDENKWNSLLLRIATTNGFIVMAFTPLHGLTWSYDRYWRPFVKLGRAETVSDRFWLHAPKKGQTIVFAQMGCADNPMARTYAEEIRQDPGMTDAEKSARLDGEYGFVEGTLIPALSGIDVLAPLPDHRQYVVNQLPGERLPDGKAARGKVVGWYLIADPNKSCGAILGALDQDDNLFLVTEHLEENWPNRKHAEAFKAMEARYATGLVQRFADYGSAGAQSIVDFGDFGLSFANVEKASGSVGASIKALRSRVWVDPKHAHPLTGAQGAPRLYFYAPGMISEYKVGDKKVRSCRTAEQISQARQTANDSAKIDTPHKDTRSKLDLFDCARYMAIIVAAVPEDTDTARAKKRMNVVQDSLLLTPDNEESSFHGLDGPFFLPDYSF